MKLLKITPSKASIFALMLGAQALFTACATTPAIPTTPVAEQPVIEQVQHQRVLPISGGNNFRDIGGYKTTDGKEVKWGKVYRSGNMARLTSQGHEQMRALGIRADIDFRTNSERKSEPFLWEQNGWSGSHEMEYITKNYEFTSSDFFKDMASPDMTGAKAKQIFAEYYREVPYDLADEYSIMVHQLLNPEGAIVYNCTAGKDRTGMATAIILHILGVPKDTIIHDYLLSNKHYRPDTPRAGHKVDPNAEYMKAIKPEVIAALNGVDKMYIDAFFDEIEKRGGWDKYVSEQLKLTPQEVATIKQNLLQ